MSRRGSKAGDRDRPPRQRRGGVLVVAEELAERRRLLDAMAPLQVELIEASSSSAALALLSGELSVDVVVAVHEQAGMSGGALCQYLRGHARLTGISSVLIAHPASLGALQLSARAADDFLSRPCDLHAVRLVVRNALRAQARRRVSAREERRRGIDWLSMVLAHEINNPLAAAMANLSLARERIADAELAPLIEESHALLERIRQRTSATRLVTRDLGKLPSSLAVPELVDQLSGRLGRHGRLTRVDAEVSGRVDGRAAWMLLVDVADALAESCLGYCGGAISARVHVEASRLAVVLAIEGECDEDPEIVLEPRLLSRDGETPRFHAGLSMIEASFAAAGGQVFARPMEGGWRFGITLPIDPVID